MSRLARRNVPATTSTFTRTQRILIITLGFVLAVGAVGTFKVSCFEREAWVVSREQTRAYAAVCVAGGRTQEGLICFGWWA